MKKTALVIMAAGIGSRFGGGIKQLEPVGPNGEIIMDYSIHDALEAGFDRIIFVIRHDLEEDFKEVIGNRIEKIAPVTYAFQELSDVPEGFSVPADRKKPWGTGQAILSIRGLVEEPFLALIGLYFLCIKEGFSIGKGDIMIFACALVFAVHILVIDYYSPKVDGVKMSCIQFFVCGIASLPVSLHLLVIRQI